MNKEFIAVLLTKDYNERALIDGVVLKKDVIEELGEQVVTLGPNGQFGVMINEHDIVWPTVVGSGEICGIAIMEEDGTVLFHSSFAMSKWVNSGDTFMVKRGDLTISI